jgi:hypothetical protein
MLLARSLMLPAEFQRQICNRKIANLQGTLTRLLR